MPRIDCLFCGPDPLQDPNMRRFVVTFWQMEQIAAGNRIPEGDLLPGQEDYAGPFLLNDLACKLVNRSNVARRGLQLLREFLECCDDDPPPVLQRRLPAQVKEDGL